MKTKFFLFLFLIPLANAQVVTYEQIKAQIFDGRCLSCHSSDHAVRGVVLDSAEEAKNFIVAGNPDNSDIYLAVSGQTPIPMPFGMEPLTAAEIDLIKMWILSEK